MGGFDEIPCYYFVNSGDGWICFRGSACAGLRRLWHVRRLRGGVQSYRARLDAYDLHHQRQAAGRA